eukprot:767705-Hanusia_phi.AAC.2
MSLCCRAKKQEAKMRQKLQQEAVNFVAAPPPFPDEFVQEQQRMLELQSKVPFLGAVPEFTLLLSSSWKQAIRHALLLKLS